MRSDLRQPSFGERGVPPVQLVGNRELEDAVAEELEALVGDGALRRPRRVRVDLVRPLCGQRIDETLQRVVCP
jgi:hypothetical protein